MPYLKPERRKQLLDFQDELRTAGDLNFMLTNMLVLYLGDRGESYQAYNDIVGALECAKLEIYRRKVAKYEDTKIQENGDVY